MTQVRMLRERSREGSAVQAMAALLVTAAEVAHGILAKFGRRRLRLPTSSIRAMRGMLTEK